MSDRIFDTDCWPAQDGRPEAQDLVFERVAECCRELERAMGRWPTRLTMSAATYEALAAHPEVAARLDQLAPARDGDDVRRRLERALRLAIEVV